MQSSTAFASSPASASSSQRYSNPVGIGSPTSSIYGAPNLPSSSTNPQQQLRDSRVPSSSHVPSLQQQLFGANVPSSGGGILDRSLNRTKGAEVALNGFAFLLSEIVSYSQSRVDSVTDLERR